MRGQPVVGAQASRNIVYNFHTLGWDQFQDLCTAVLGASLGQSIQTFSPVGDGGRDGAFYSSQWNPKSRGCAGTGTVQCKFSSTPNAQLRVSDLSEEFTKARDLAAQGLATNYILITNCGYRGSTDEGIRRRLLSIPGIDYAEVLGRQWLTREITGNAELRMLVPRVYGLGDLTQILDERRRRQAEEILAYLGGDLDKFVNTDAYWKSVGAISEDGFVLLLGAPAAGKTTIAAALATGSIDRWDCVPIRVTSGKEFREAWNPNEKQFFWIDDAFGAMQYQSTKADDWNQTFPSMLTAVRRGARIVFTSRSYIFEQAERDLKMASFPALREARVRINVESYTLRERESILYNHLRLGSQPLAFKAKLRDSGLLHDIAAHRRFSPVVAKRLGNPSYTRGLVIARESLMRFVDDQREFVIETLKELDRASYGALALVFLNGGGVEAPINASGEERDLLERLGTNIVEARAAMSAMAGDFVKRIPYNGRFYWRFDHPSIGDALATILSSDIEQLEIYLRGASLERVLGEVKCVGSPVKGAVEVPKSCYKALLDRMSAVGDMYELCSFLEHRADGSFLRAFLKRFPDFLERLVGRAQYSMFSSQSRLLVRLNRAKLIDSDLRAVAVAKISENALRYLNIDFIRSMAGGLLTEDETLALIDRIRWEAIPRITSIIDNLENSYSEPDDPNDHFSDLLASLDELKDRFLLDSRAVKSIDDAVADIEERIETLQAALPGENDDQHEQVDEPETISNEETQRDFFEDVADAI